MLFRQNENVSHRKISSLCQWGCAVNMHILKEDQVAWNKQKIFISDAEHTHKQEWGGHIFRKVKLAIRYK